MALATETELDNLVEFELVPGSYRAFLETLAESGRPRLKCFRGSVTLVAPKRAHESAGNRVANLILAVCQEFGIAHEALASTTWDVPTWKDDTGYEADECFYIESFGTDDPDRRPDLAVEVLNAGRDTKARACGEALGIPEMWVVDVRRHKLTFFTLAGRGPQKGKYLVATRSRALPMLSSEEVLARLDDPERDTGAFHENCRRWAREVLAPRGAGARRKGRRTE